MKKGTLRTASFGCLLALSAAVACAAVDPDQDARRVELIARVERSVVIVLAEGLDISHPPMDQLTLVTSESLGTSVRR